MRTGVTIEEVTRAADLLLEQGERPTVDGIRAALGTGSPATVNALLKDYFKALGERLKLPAPIALAAADLYKRLQETAQAAAAEREAEAQAELKRERDQLQAERTTMAAEASQLRNQVTGLSTELSGARDRIADLERQLAAAQTESAAQARVATAASAKAEAAIEERDRQGRKHQEELTHQRERAEGNERHFLAQIDELKTQNKRLAGDREKDQQAAAKRVGELEAKLKDQGAELAEQRKEVMRVGNDLSREQRAHAGLQAEFKALQESSGREIESLRGQHRTAVAEREAERQQVATLRSERDAAFRESAKHQGTAEALQGQLARLQAASDKKPRAGG